jgi:hypothetical protein
MMPIKKIVEISEQFQRMEKDLVPLVDIEKK